MITKNLKQFNVHILLINFFTQAHINHRHVATPANENLNQFGVHNQKMNDLRGKPDSRIQPVATASPFYENQKQKLYEEQDAMNYASPRAQDQANSVPRSNLITVPIQEPPPQDSYYPSYNAGYYPPTYQDYPPPQTDTSVPPPQQWNSNQQFYG